MTEKEKRTSERLASLFKRLSDQDKDHLLVYGMGMADMAERMIRTTDSAPRPEPQK